MSQIFEALRRAEALEASRRQTSEIGQIASPERRRNERRPVTARIRVYGHGPGVAPFFEEISILNVSEASALLIMKIPVVAGQKLLLINEAAEQVQECRVVRTRCRNTQELEVAVEFPTPHADLWRDLGKKSEPGGIEKRTSPRIVLPRGMSIAWKGAGKAVVSRVQTISTGGLSIAAPEPPPAGESIVLRFQVPDGDVVARAIVRHSRPGEGMGVEFMALPAESRARLDHLLRKLFS